jgi:ribosomal protein L37AE/L43A
MGLFRRAGRKVERLKRSVESAADEEASHTCTECAEPFFADRETCSECGGSVVPVD